MQTENPENSSKTEQRQDSEPEPSNIEGKTNESNTNESDSNDETIVGAAEVYQNNEAVTEPTTTEPAPTTSTTTETPTTITTTTIKPSTEEQIRRLHEKLDSHVENIKRFKEDAGKKLRDAIERSNTRSAVDDFDDMPSSLFDESVSMPILKQNRDFACNTV